ncbi:hypothetical protein J7444_09220 [Labrenzia sp. R4_1]|uniref:hypothetical protein n=1 Tax=Labrenzia sp. R4_1 TaxID=2821106 RepID=UPI001ADD2AC8|nr:hypothetical protein [Labrenzia sp. R4_1]MBO9424902.1 hypothetical protein [Labrenzia sp. R4_1]
MLSDILENLQKYRYKKYETVDKIVKIIFIGAGTLIVTAVSIIQAHQSQGSSFIPMIGVFSAILVFCGFAYTIFLEQSVNDAIEEARKYQKKSTESLTRINELKNSLEIYASTTKALQNLYVVANSQSTLIVGLLGQSQVEVGELLQNMLTSLRRQIVLSARFENEDIWTICIYRAEWIEESKNHILLPVAHLRAIHCELAHARKWPAGVGVSGTAFSKMDEVIAPDLQDPNIGNVFDLSNQNGSLQRKRDRTTHRSLFAVPVTLADEDTPWGVVIASVNVSNHFGNEDRFGSEPEEAIRALAALIEQAVTINRFNMEMASVSGTLDTSKKVTGESSDEAGEKR